MFLADKVSVGIGGMAKRLDLVMGDPASGDGVGEPNGFAGVEQRGPLDRLLLSDWALVDLDPDEFLPRLTSAELLYLRREYNEPRPPRQISVLIDSGPDQIGAPRLAQLAGLVVLSRRAQAHDIQLLVGIAGDEPGQWISADLPVLFNTWLGSRRTTSITPEVVAAWNDTLDRDTNISWIFGASRLTSSAIPEKCRHLWATESQWGPAGATELVVTVDGRTLNLDLPDASTSIRMLRGHGIRRHSKLSVIANESQLRFPCFPGSPRRLVCRGAKDNEIAVIGVPKAPTEPGGRSRIRTFPGSVLAASLIGSRTVALVAVGEYLRVVVNGKRLGQVDTINVPLRDLEIDHQTVDDIASDGLAPLYFQSGSVIFRLGDQWWSIKPPATARKIYPLVLAATTKSDQPCVASMRGGWLWCWGNAVEILDEHTRVLIGSGGTTSLVAAETEPGRWRVYRHHTTSTITVKDDETAVGLFYLFDVPTLLVRSKGGLLLRLATDEGVHKTLTKLSGDVASVAVHPTEPLVVVYEYSGTINVFDLELGQSVLHIGAGKL